MEITTYWISLLQSKPTIWIFFVALFGALIGSFVGCLSHRLPKRIFAEIYHEEPVSSVWQMLMSRSACPNCHTTIPFYYNIPIISWIYLKGRCFACEKKIAKRYFLIELQFTLSFIAIAIFLPIGTKTLFFILFTCFVWMLFWTDLEHYLLPDIITLTMLWCGLIVNLNYHVVALQEAVLGVIWGYLSLWSINAVFKLVRHKQGISNGDFKFFAAIGAWLGVNMLPFVLLGAALLAIVITVFLYLMNKTKIQTIRIQRPVSFESSSSKYGNPTLTNRDNVQVKPQSNPLDIAIPFGTYLAIVAWGMFFYKLYFSR